MRPSPEWHQEAKRLYESGNTAIQIARWFGVDRSSVYYAINETKRSVASARARRRYLAKHPEARTYDTSWHDLARSMRSEGMSMRAIGRALRRSTSRVHSVLHEERN